LKETREEKEGRKNPTLRGQVSSKLVDDRGKFSPSSLHILDDGLSVVDRRKEKGREEVISSQRVLHFAETEEGRTCPPSFLVDEGKQR